MVRQEADEMEVHSVMGIFKANESLKFTIKCYRTVCTLRTDKSVDI